MAGRQRLWQCQTAPGPGRRAGSSAAAACGQRGAAPWAGQGRRPAAAWGEAGLGPRHGWDCTPGTGPGARPLQVHGARPQPSPPVCRVVLNPGRQERGTGWGELQADSPLGQTPPCSWCSAAMGTAYGSERHMPGAGSLGDHGREPAGVAGPPCSSTAQLGAGHAHPSLPPKPPSQSGHAGVSAPQAWRKRALLYQAARRTRTARGWGPGGGCCTMLSVMRRCRVPAVKYTNAAELARAWLAARSSMRPSEPGSRTGPGEKGLSCGAPTR